VGFEVEATRTSWAGLLTETGHSIMELFYKTWALKTKTYTYPNMKQFSQNQQQTVLLRMHKSSQRTNT
jgi:hypothetical protein